MSTDGQTTDYTYDSANRLLTAGDASYTLVLSLAGLTFGGVIGVILWLGFRWLLP